MNVKTVDCRFTRKRHVQLIRLRPMNFINGSGHLGKKQGCSKNIFRHLLLRTVKTIFLIFFCMVGSLGRSFHGSCQYIRVYFLWRNNRRLGLTVIPGGFLGFCDKKQGKSCQNLVALFSFAAKVLFEMYIADIHKKGIYYVHHAIDCSLLEVGICKYIPTYYP